ncbi:MAG: hypothetical protein HY743_01045 [Deltaproteobacteria bacterium]|nr:hypothetical protein [Deltaproteobacteria bacterium]
MEQMKCPGQDTRFWKPGDIFVAQCPKCGAEIEFFKDDARRRCAWCGHMFYNPKIALGCAEWCQYAEKCVPDLMKEKAATQTFKERLAELVHSRLQDSDAWERTEKGMQYALDLLKSEGGDPRVVLAAVLLHRVKPDQARKFLEELAAEADTVAAVMDLLAGRGAERDLNRQLYEDTLALLDPQSHPLFHTRTAQRLAEEGEK